MIIDRRSAAFILLLEGLASSGLQMICIRQTVPFVGSSVLTTSVIISTFLAALAIGYFRGGRHSSENHLNKLTHNLILSVGIFGIGLSYPFIAPFFEFSTKLAPHIPLLGNPLVQLSLFCLVVMCPLVFFLGQTVPLLLHSAKASTSKSEATGNATALSTIGNVIGALLTSLVLMYFLGVGYSIFINCLILASCLFFIKTQSKLRYWYVAPVTGLLLVLTFYLNILLPNQTFVKTTPYANFEIKNYRQGKAMIVNNSRASFLTHKTKQGWPYIEMLKLGLFSKHSQGKTVLVLGAGGFTLTAKQEYGAQFTYVDIDPAIKDIAEQQFLGAPIKGHFVAKDARLFLKQTEALWDIIIVDLYTNAGTIPLHTSTIEFFDLVGSKLKPQGTAAINLSADPTLVDRYAQRMDHTIRQALSRCVTDITNYNGFHANILYFCGPPTHPKPALEVYRDQTTQAAVDSYLSRLRLHSTLMPLAQVK